MTEPEHRLQLAPDDFRRDRAMLAPEAFALSEGDDPPINDLVDKATWDHVVHVPDDVAIRTTNWTGSVTDLIHGVSSEWLFAIPIHREGAPYASEPAILAYEEFEALGFAALHGFYRQALGCLRNALETMAHAAACAATANEEQFRRWRAGEVDLRFGDSRAVILGSVSGREIEGRSRASVFGSVSDSGWLAMLYRRLCAYAHSQAGCNNADFWEGNGPVYSPRAYALVLDELRESVAMCYVLLRICWPEFELSDNLLQLLDHPALSNWPLIARSAFVAAFNPTRRVGGSSPRRGLR